MDYVHIAQLKINNMLYTRLTNCPECVNIPELLKRIDCKLAELGNSLYNNISFMLNQSVPATDMLQLIAYKRILMYKNINPNYVYHYSISKIASKVILLTLGCESKPMYTPTVRVTTTTTTTPCPTTTTTTTTIAPEDCTSWYYNIDLYYCDSCTRAGGGSVSNSEPLTIGKWYYYQGFKMLIETYTACYADVSPNNISNLSGKDTCEEVICPTTTTTTVV
jgi:hypothetical protein